MATSLPDGDDRLADEAGPEQRRLPEIPRRAYFVQVHADEVWGEHADDFLDLEGREPERLRISDGRRERGIHAVDVDRKVHLVAVDGLRSEEHTSELQSPMYLVCRLLLEKKNKYAYT